MTRISDFDDVVNAPTANLPQPSFVTSDNLNHILRASTFTDIACTPAVSDKINRM